MEPTKKYQNDLKKALKCAETGKAYHWPTIAEILAMEIQRLNSLINDLIALSKKQIEDN